jgi:hypothetical protein
MSVPHECMCEEAVLVRASPQVYMQAMLVMEPPPRCYRKEWAHTEAAQESVHVAHS